MHAACWKGRGSRRVSRNFQNRPWGKGDELMEGLPMIRPGAVDICRPMMVRYSGIYGITR